MVALSFEHEQIEQIWPYLEFSQPNFYITFLNASLFFNVTKIVTFGVTRHPETKNVKNLLILTNFSPTLERSSFEHEQIEQIWPYLEFPQPNFYITFLNASLFFNVTKIVTFGVTRHPETNNVKNWLILTNFSPTLERSNLNG